jgi:GTPase KRas
MRTGEGFLLIYSITSRASFDEILEIYPQILSVKDRDSFPAVLVASNCEREDEREVGIHGTFHIDTTIKQMLTPICRRP